MYIHFIILLKTSLKLMMFLKNDWYFVKYRKKGV